MKKMHFVSILTASVMLFFVPFRSGPVFGFHEGAPASDGSSSTTSTSVPASINTIPRSPSKNSNLTIDLYPQRNVMWEPCAFAAQRYCFEPVTVSDLDGKERSASAWPSSNCHNNNFSTELCAMDGSDWLEVGLSSDFSEATSQRTSHWKLRTGKLSPDILMMGDTQKTVIGGDAIDGWTIEIWAKPALKAYLDGCYSASTCPETSVASNVSYKISGYLRMLGINASWPSVASESLRNALRGTFISTNGMSQNWVFDADKFYVASVSPHFLPPDSSGKSAVTPGFVRVFLPKSYITLDRGYNDLSLVTPDRVELRVSGENALAKIARQEDGLLVDTGVEHFSAPNPEMKLLKADVASTTTVAPTTTVAAVSTLKKGASKTLSSIAKTEISQKPKWSVSGSCKIVGAKLVALKKTGTCKLTLRVLNAKKKYVVQTTKSFKVS